MLKLATIGLNAKATTGTGGAIPGTIVNGGQTAVEQVFAINQYTGSTTGDALFDKLIRVPSDPWTLVQLPATTGVPGQAAIPIGISPPVLDHNGNLIFVTNNFDTRTIISAVNKLTGAIAWSVAILGVTIFSLAVDASGNIGWCGYMAASNTTYGTVGAGYFNPTSPTGGWVQAFTNHTGNTSIAFTYPSQCGFDSVGNLVVPWIDGPYLVLMKLNNAGTLLWQGHYQTVTLASNNQIISGNISMVMDPSDNIYLALLPQNVGGGFPSVCKFASNGTYLAEWAIELLEPPPSPTSKAYGTFAMCIDANNHLNVVVPMLHNGGTGSLLLQLTTAGVVVWQRIIPLITMVDDGGICCDAAGNIYVGTTQFGVKYSNAGVLQASWFGPAHGVCDASNFYALTVGINANFLEYAVLPLADIGQINSHATDSIGTKVFVTNLGLIDSPGTVTISITVGSGYVEPATDSFVYATFVSGIVVGSNTSTAGLVAPSDSSGAAPGGLVWLKSLTTTMTHGLFDTIRGPASVLHIETTAAVDTEYGLGFLDNGILLTGISTYDVALAFQQWSFMRHPKLMDIVAYVGNGATNRVITHQLTIPNGMVMIKAISTTGSWLVSRLNGTVDMTITANTAAGSTLTNITNTAATGQITVNNQANANGVAYIAYIFGHDISPAGMIRCGTFTSEAALSSGDGTLIGAQAIALGWEPQYLLLNNETSGKWCVGDTAMGISQYLSATLPIDQAVPPTNGDGSNADPYLFATANGFSVVPQDYIAGNAVTHYLAIRRGSMLVPFTGVSVFTAIARTGHGGTTGNIFPGFSPDMVLSNALNAGAPQTNTAIYDRVRGGGAYVQANTMAAEQLVQFSLNFGFNNYNPDHTFGSTTNNGAGVDVTGVAYIDYVFRRAPGFFDVTTCLINGSTATPVTHAIGYIPELIMLKATNNAAAPWLVYHKAYPQFKMTLDLTATQAGTLITSPLIDGFTLQPTANYNANDAVVAYLFGTTQTVSMVSSYTGNGSSLTINCGFAAGARFILLHCATSPGHWYIYDTTRGITGTSSPALVLDTGLVIADTAITPAAAGFTVSQVNTSNLNLAGQGYIFFAIS